MMTTRTFHTYGQRRGTGRPLTESGIAARPPHGASSEGSAFSMRRTRSLPLLAQRPFSPIRASSNLLAGSRRSGVTDQHQCFVQRKRGNHSFLVFLFYLMVTALRSMDCKQPNPHPGNASPSLALVLESVPSKHSLQLFLPRFVPAELPVRILNKIRSVLTLFPGFCMRVRAPALTVLKV